MKSISYSEERSGLKYNFCLRCETPTILLGTGCLQWVPDENPYCDGEDIEDIELPTLKEYVDELNDGIELGEEITFHFCPKCKKITSVCVNWDF